MVNDISQKILFLFFKLSSKWKHNKEHTIKTYGEAWPTMGSQEKKKVNGTGCQNLNKMEVNTNANSRT